MFQSLIEDLKAKEVLSSSDIKELREYIKNKYPNRNSEQVSIILADAIKKVINSNILQFNDVYKQKIRESILKLSIQKNEFSVNAEDMFRSFVSLNILKDDYLSSLTEWVNRYHASGITKEELRDFVHNYSEINSQSVHTDASSANKVEEPETSKHLVHIEKNNSLNENIIDINFNMKLTTYKDKLFYGLKNKPYYKAASILIFTIICASGFLIYGNSAITADSDISEKQAQIQEMLSIDSIIDKYNNKNINNTEYLYNIEHDIHEELKFQAIDQNALVMYLKNKNSILAQEPFFTTIIEIARQYNINPLLMFAITGQEQGFVPADSKQARRIANNPFNVCGSWQEYNTDISDSAAIAARTILNLAKNRPVYRDPIEWINRKYAEDKNWWKNVRIIFETLKGEISYIE